MSLSVVIRSQDEADRLRLTGPSRQTVPAEARITSLPPLRARPHAAAGDC